MTDRKRAAATEYAEGRAPQGNGPTLILGAMPSEIVSLKRSLHRSSESEFEGYPYVRGILERRRVVLVVTGVGITNSAMTTALFIHQMRPREVLFTGSGARINPRLRTGDTIIARKSYHHNAGSLTETGMVYRSVRGPTAGSMTPYGFSADPGLLRLARSAIASYRPRSVTLEGRAYFPTVAVGSVCSSDLFGVNQARIDDIREKLGCDLMEMESSAVGQVCRQLKMPHLVIRGGSNRAQPNPGKHYRRLGQIAAHQAANFTRHLVSLLA